jgi:hypothetical protein
MTCNCCDLFFKNVPPVPHGVQMKKAPIAGSLLDIGRRAGIEPTTNGLKVRSKSIHLRPAYSINVSIKIIYIIDYNINLYLLRPIMHYNRF